MRPIDVIEFIIDEIESVVDRPVHMAKGFPDHVQNGVKLEDSGHSRMDLGNSNWNGVATDDSGNPIGKSELYAYEASPEIIPIDEHQTEAYRVTDRIQQHFEQLEDDIRRHKPDFREFSVEESGPKKVGTRLADDVYHRSIPLDLMYVHTSVVEADALVSIHNEIENDEGGTVEHTVN